MPETWFEYMQRRNAEIQAAFEPYLDKLLLDEAGIDFAIVWPVAEEKSS
jgi:hypothetical protein